MEKTTDKSLKKREENNNNSFDGRIKYVDVMKGIGILLMVFQHCACISTGIYKLILAFHMPLFFFISGYMIAKQGADISYNSNSSLHLQLGKKVIKLIIPYMFICLINYVIRILARIIGILTVSTYEDSLYQMFCLGGQWFILSLMFATVAFCFIHKMSNKWYYRAITVFLASGTALVYSSIWGGKENMLCSGMVGLLFYYAGYLWFKLIKYIGEEKWKYLSMAVVSIILLVVVNKFNPTGVMMYLNNYGNELVFVMCAIFGIVFIYSVSRIISSCRILEYFGKNSLIIVFINFPIFKCMSCIFNKLGYSTATFPTVLIDFIIVVLLLIPCIYVINRYFPFIIGNINIRKGNTEDSKTITHTVI